jgi:hypothetical protein
MLMEVTLPSGATVTLRDKLTARDKFAVQDAVHLSLNTATGMQDTTAGLVNDMRNALLARLIQSWTVPGVTAGADGLGELDLDDYNALAEAVEPLLSKVVQGGSPNRSTGTS